MTKHPEVPQVQVPHVQVVAETVEISQLQAVEKIVETRETQTIQSIQTSESSVTAPVRQVSQAGVVEVHPTDVVKPDGPDAKLKFLAEEALHGVGGFIFDANGNRVANLMGRQNCVTGEMWKNTPPFSPSLNNAISDDIAWQRKHYTGRGVRKLHESGTTLAEGMEALVSKMPNSIEAHCQASLKSAKDPDGGPSPAFARLREENSITTSVREQISQHSPSVSQSTRSPHPRCSGTQTGPLIQRVQKMEEVPQVQFIDKVIDIPVISERQMSMMMIPTVQRRGGKRKDRIKTLMSSGSRTWSCHPLNRASV